MRRFEIVVINHGRLFSFFNNLYKIKNIGDNDRITILSNTPSQEERNLVTTLKNCRYIEHKENSNTYLLNKYLLGTLGDESNLNSQFFFSMQEHYLDTDSAFSKWGANWNFRIKGDVIADNAIYDLDDVEQKYNNDSNLVGVYCDRRGPERFHLFDGKRHITMNGSNQIVRTSKLKRPEVQKALAVLFSFCTGDLEYNWGVLSEYLFGTIFFDEKETHYDVRRSKFIHSFENASDFNDTTDDYVYLERQKAQVQAVLAALGG